jgi:protein-tyrosine-phosphatase
MKIVVVCTGNSCRSPMAEGLFRYHADREGLHDLEITSAGTVAVTGLSPSPNAVRVSAESGIDISWHRSKPLTVRLVETGDLILTMERGQADVARRLGGNGRTYLITEYPGRPGSEVLDPIGGTLEAYRTTFDLLESEVRRIIGHLKQEAGVAEGGTGGHGG